MVLQWSNLSKVERAEYMAECPAHRLVGGTHYCGIGVYGDLLCWAAYKHACQANVRQLLEPGGSPIFLKCPQVSGIPTGKQGERNEKVP